MLFKVFLHHGVRIFVPAKCLYDLLIFVSKAQLSVASLNPQLLYQDGKTCQGPTFKLNLVTNVSYEKIKFYNIDTIC